MFPSGFGPSLGLSSESAIRRCTLVPYRATRFGVREALKAVLDQLLATSHPGGTITVDEVGHAVGTLSVGSGDLEALFDALEAQGRTVTAPQGGQGEANLHKVLKSARALRGTLGRTPNKAEIAADCGLSEHDVHLTLELVKIMQR